MSDRVLCVRTVTLPRWQLTCYIKRHVVRHLDHTVFRHNHKVRKTSSPAWKKAKVSISSSMFLHLLRLDLPLNPTNPLLSQQFTRPSSHDPQVPSYMMGCTHTRSPTAKLSETSSPTSAIVPLNSCPNVSGIVSPVMGCGVVGQSDGPPRNSWRSQEGC